MVEAAPYRPTQDEVSEALSLIESYWNPLAEEQVRIWLSRLGLLRSGPGVLKQTIEELLEAGSRYAPNLGQIVRRHNELMSQQTTWQRTTYHRTVKPKRGRLTPGSPEWRAKEAALRVTGFSRWDDYDARRVALGAYFEEFGWPTVDLPGDVPKVKEMVALATKRLQEAGTLEVTLERYQALRAEVLERLGRGGGGGGGEGATVRAVAEARGVAPNPEDDEIPF